MKTTKGGKVMNPTDSYRKELRKKELKRNKKERKKVREVGILKKDPDSLKDQIGKLEMMKADGALDKARKHKKRQLEDTLNLVLKKRKEYEEKQKEKGETPVMFSHLGPPPKRLTPGEEEERDKYPKPEDSVYFHPTLNPTGHPPPGKPPMFKSSIGPRVPSLEASSSGTASTSMTEPEDVTYELLPPPPPPLSNSGELVAGDGSAPPASLPLPPPPPLPPKPAVQDLDKSLPPRPFPPPPPGPPPPREQAAVRLPPPPPVQQQPPQPLPPGIREISDNPNPKETTKVHVMLPPPPPPPGLPSKPRTNHSEGALSETNTNNPSGPADFSKMIPPPPPPRQQPSMPLPPQMPTLHPDLLLPGISRYPPPPPPQDMRPPPGVPGQVAPPGMMVPQLIPRPPPYGLPPGPPPLSMMRPPLPPGPPPLPPFVQEDGYGVSIIPQASHKPSYVKSAASTVVKRPLAQHTPELTSMVPASVRVRRETAVSKAKPRPPPPATATSSSTTHHMAAPTYVKPKPPANSLSSAPKAQSIDDSYMAFLEDMKVLGALDD